MLFWVMPLVKVRGQLGTSRAGAEGLNLQSWSPAPAVSKIPSRHLMSPQIRLVESSVSAPRVLHFRTNLVSAAVCSLSLHSLHHPFTGSWSSSDADLSQAFLPFQASPSPPIPL